MKSKFIFCLLIISLIISSCSSSKKISYNSAEARKKEKKQDEKEWGNSAGKEASSVVKAAYKFLGTPYKYGGTTRSGLDCSGLVINSFEAIGFQMPRMSREQASKGKEVRLKDVREGDLVFFTTSGSNINHVGIVEKVKNGEIFFIHSSTSKGVIVSSMEETYWNKRFVKATRVL